MLINYLLPFILALVASIGLTPLVIGFVKKRNLAMPAVRDRDVHKSPVPRLGGVAIFIAFWLLVVSYWLLAPEKLHFTDTKIIGIDQNLLGVFIGSIILLIVGVIDDVKGVKPLIKLFWQFIAAFIVVFFGIKIWWFSNPLGGANVGLSQMWNYILVPLWIVLIINVVNWLDGLDGLADGISMIALIILGLLAMSSNVNQPATALMCAILSGAALGFLFFNFNPAKIFLGDSGSMFLGFMVAVAAIISGGKVATALLVLGIPILDALWVIARRIFNKKSPMQADKYHLHHRFLAAGFNQKQTVIILYTISASFGIIALQNNTQGKVVAGLWLLVLMVIIGLVLIFANKKRIKHE